MGVGQEVLGWPTSLPEDHRQYLVVSFGETREIQRIGVADTGVQSQPHLVQDVDEPQNCDGADCYQEILVDFLGRR